MNIEGRLENHVFPKLGALDIHEIDSDDIAALAGRIARRAPVAANRVLADLRRIFAWALRNKRCDTNPAAGIDSPGEETERERVLNDDEIARLRALGYMK